MARDWLEWYKQYDDPTSSLGRRLQVVQEQLAATMRSLPDSARLLSLCAGDGRDTLPVLAEVAPHVTATLVELNGELAERARRTAADLGLGGVTVRTGDAGDCRSHRGSVPADVVLMCGVFGNVRDKEVANTVEHLPELLAPGGVVIWTRGSRVDRDPSEWAGDPSEYVRGLLAAGTFEELAFVKPDDAGFRVGVHRLLGPPRPFDPAVQLFTFVN
jgi:hypothetical protein